MIQQKILLYFLILIALSIKRNIEFYRIKLSRNIIIISSTRYSIIFDNRNLAREKKEKRRREEEKKRREKKKRKKNKKKRKEIENKRRKRKIRER